MTDTTILINRLSSEAVVSIPLRTPGYWALRLVAIVLVYGFAVQLVLGLRPDLMQQLGRPLFAAEIGLLTALLFTSIIASILAMYPDAYQKRWLLHLPYAVFLLLAGMIILQLFMPIDATMVMPQPGAHRFECTLCIAAVALIPAALLFIVLRKGASVHPYQAGSFAVLAASAIGCLTLRLSEMNDSLYHLAGWHYLPTVLFAVLGAYLGKLMLKW